MIDAYTFEQRSLIFDELYKVRSNTIKNISNLFEELKLNNIHE